MTKVTYTWTTQGVVEKPDTHVEFTPFEQTAIGLMVEESFAAMRRYEEAVLRAMMGAFSPIPPEPITFEWRGTADRVLKFDAPAVRLPLMISDGT